MATKKATKKATPKVDRTVPRCELCGQPNPSTDEGYTSCCNELEVWPGDQGYEEAINEWYRR